MCIYLYLISNLLRFRFGSVHVAVWPVLRLDSFYLLSCWHLGWGCSHTRPAIQGGPIITNIRRRTDEMTFVVEEIVSIATSLANVLLHPTFSRADTVVTVCINATGTLEALSNTRLSFVRFAVDPAGTVTFDKDTVVRASIALDIACTVGEASLRIAAVVRACWRWSGYHRR